MSLARSQNTLAATIVQILILKQILKIPCITFSPGAVDLAWQWRAGDLSFAYSETTPKDKTQIFNFWAQDLFFFQQPLGTFPEYANERCSALH